MKKKSIEKPSYIVNEEIGVVYCRQDVTGRIYNTDIKSKLCYKESKLSLIQKS